MLYSNNTELNSPFSSRNHATILLKCHISKYVVPTVYKYVYIYKFAGYQGFYECISIFSWVYIFSDDISVDDRWNLFKCIIDYVIKSYVLK